jgi:hypothetical protein
VTEPTPVWSVALPADAEPPFDVFVEGRQLTAEEFSVEGRWLRLTGPVRVPPPKLGLGGRILLSIGIGVYKDRVDTIDLRYRAGGEIRNATGLTVIPPQ